MQTNNTATSVIVILILDKYSPTSVHGLIMILPRYTNTDATLYSVILSVTFVIKY